MPSVFGKGHFNGGLYGKRRREKLIFLFVAGLALSIFVMVVVIFVSKSATANRATVANSEEVEPAAGTVILFSSERIIPAGTKISAPALKSIYWPKNLAPENAITDIAAFENTYAKTDIPAGEPITAASLTEDRSEVSGLQVQQGMRAVTIEVDAKRGIEGWALPGTRVDVILTFKDSGELTSKIVVENSRVLSVAGDSSGNGDRLPSGRHRVNTPTTVTLEVSPKDALKLETAAQLGKLSLHLRSNDDSKASGVESFASSGFDDQAKKAAQEKLDQDSQIPCQKGKMKIEGKEYLIDCNGNLVPAS